MFRCLPEWREFEIAATRGNLIPVYCELVADGDTPVSAYAKLGGGNDSFLLESVVGGEKWAAFSFIGVSAHARYRAREGRYQIEYLAPDGAVTKIEEGSAPDPIAPLGALLARYRPVVPPSLPRFFGGAVGYLSYDAVRAFERLPSTLSEELDLPDAAFVITDTIVIFDNLRQTIKVVACPYVEPGSDLRRAYELAMQGIAEIVARLRSLAPLRTLGLDGTRPLEHVRSNTSREDFVRNVQRAKEFILAGDIFQVVLSQRFSVELGVDAFDVYRALRVVNPSPYMFHLQFPELRITGASPEVLVRVESGNIEVRPIAGTRPRGGTHEEDLRLEAELRASPKECAEHVMLIDLGRNDVGRVARLGSVSVDEQMVVERYSHVMHLVSSVVGEVRPDRQALDVLRACFPAGTLTGAPKIRAMQIIEALEPIRRGLYGGAVGYLSYTGNLDLAIAIRTLLNKDGRYYFQAGAGIVADSDPEAEYEETVAKARAMVRALEMAAAT